MVATHCQLKSSVDQVKTFLCPEDARLEPGSDAKTVCNSVLYRQLFFCVHAFDDAILEQGEGGLDICGALEFAR